MYEEKNDLLRKRFIELNKMVVLKRPLFHIYELEIVVVFFDNN